jgi:chemotaxis protein methyltransferase CheR
MTAARVGATDDFLEFCRGVQSLCRIDLEQYKRAQMERRIRTFAAGRGVPKLPDYLKVLKRDRTELEAFLDRITINVSQLWRNPDQWDVLAKHVLPELAAAGRLRAWSAGCSYGAEAYTLAAVAADAIPGTRIEIRGTDIDERIIAKAKTARFNAADARTAPRKALEKWFVREGGEWVAKPELTRGMRFDTGDLLRMRIAPGSFDLILCRNTVIYFNQEVRDDLHARLVEALRPGGVLVIGATERVSDAPRLGLTATHPFTYRKAA